MKKLNKIILLLFCLCSVHAYGQKTAYKNEQEKIAVIEQRIEWLAENIGDEEPDLNALFDRLFYLIDHPLNLNKATKDQLEDLMLLTDLQINELLTYLEQNGNLMVIYEIQTLPSWDMTTIEEVLPFVYVKDKFTDPHLTLSQMLKSSSSELYLRWGKVLEDQAGYVPDANGNTKYLGSNDRVYTRYRFKSANNVSIGFTAEKDPGEEFFRGTQKSFDFYSGHAYLHNIGKIKHLVIGDYLTAFGQGLTIGIGPAFGKTASSLGIKRPGYQFKPFTSVNETQFLRGVAGTIDLKPVEVSFFYSNKKIDGNIITTDSTTNTDDGIAVSSIQTSGLHNTTSTLADKNALGENIIGGDITFRKRVFDIGITSYAVNYSGALQQTFQYYNQYEFNGTSNMVSGLHYSAVVKNVHFFGETSMSKNKKIGSLNGLIMSLDPKCGIVLAYRYYQKDFQNNYTNAFAEATFPFNERGLYMGIEIKPTTKWIINGYADMFNSEWLRYNVNGPSKGNEYLAQITYKPNKQTEIYFRFRQRTKEYNTDVDVNDIRYLSATQQTNYRINLLHKVSKTLTLHSRIEQLVLKPEEEPVQYGFMALQDIIYKPLSSPFSFNLRYAVFNTDNYDTRIYAFENDILYYYAIPAYYYRGSRIYFNVRYQYKKWFDAWIKIGQWLYDNRTTIGSGNDEILGNQKTEIRAQIRFSF